MMPTPDLHTYGPKCRLAPVSELEPPEDLVGIPPIHAQFFYSSAIPIDDPLSPATIAGSTDSRAARSLLRPFSTGDNNALERAWLALATDDDRQNHWHAQRYRSPSPALAKRNAEKLSTLIQDLALKHRDKHLHEESPSEYVQTNPGSVVDVEVPVCCQELLIDASNELRENFCEVTRRRLPLLDHDKVVQGVMSILKSMEPAPVDSGVETRPRASSVSSAASRTDHFPLSAMSAPLRQRTSSLVGRRDADDRARTMRTSVDATVVRDSQGRTDPQSVIAEVLPVPFNSSAGSPVPVRPPPLDDGISGKPFVRAGDSSDRQSSAPAPLQRQDPGAVADKAPKRRAIEAIHQQDTNPVRGRGQSKKKLEDNPDIPVGISRLHMVSLPGLLMKPIYWSPVNDIAIVMRATWFYRDTMIPVEPAVANQLEAGYRELRPYTETWNDELRCAVEVGALGEEKVSHRLWPKIHDPGTTDIESGDTEPTISSDPFCAARCFRGEASAEGTLEPVHPADEELNAAHHLKNYANHHVIYKDGGTAFLLKPSLKPSAYYNRRPLAKVSKGITVGIPLVRGFDRMTWARIHEKKKVSQFKDLGTLQGEAPGPAVSTSAGCPGCEAEKQSGQVTDLVLVAHGIGQKFAERVESFHFTHAINTFRRAVNMELESDVVRSVVRKAQNGIMVLPINWRHTLSFEDGGPMKEEDKAAYMPEGFGLKDIEPNTIPAVRSMISDVMFDIPFYMSHHKPKMIQALVSEANRVYRLWCRNNPGFTQNGRIHLIGHSLGSAMALEVLSRQPTRVPPIDLSRALPEASFFEFDTTNLFLLGSPAGFFLLLERGNLTPRRGRAKPGADTADTLAKDVVGEAGAFGCLAVDNIYNILAKEDPIAYLLNGTIDPLYASTLKVAYVPGATVSWFKSMGDAVRNLVPGASAAPDITATPLAKPPTVRLPSQLELEVHDFTREEIAEKKAYLLNDNGQIDYYLRSGGGPLEIQYLNMLSAHTSYWANQDLIRMLCMEIGREPGKATALPGLKAVKAVRRLRAHMT